MPELKLLPSKLFYCDQANNYPPFKNGLYLEEYFLEWMKSKNLSHDNQGRLYIPVLWTNFQIRSWFNGKKELMQEFLDKYIQENKCENGYFIVIQYDDGPLLKLPENTIIYGGCSGTHIIPLIYQDNQHRLETAYQNSVSKNTTRNITCSFIGVFTHKVRTLMAAELSMYPGFKIINSGGWTPTVNAKNQDIFINTTLKSKFALTPRGYGRSSFRFFEVIKLGAIPIYIWNDIEWLPYKEKIDYTKFSISINIKDIGQLPNMIDTIIKSGKYEEMLEEINRINQSGIFDYDYMCEYIIMNQIQV